ncbi:MAG: type II toxin-antitoxin system HicB family antitoxin [Clostridia bacterium]|nr:type II toxin-antitoxin system HicB family antitoxin [Clostridia bacterium]
MATHLYPAIFTEESDGYSVTFPDFEGCFSEGDTLEEAYEMAIDALGLYLEDSEKAFKYPKATNPKSIITNENEFVVMVEFNMIEYMKKHDDKAIKKTLTIPAWLNELAVKENVNFSQTLQNALIEQLKIAQ